MGTWPNGMETPPSDAPWSRLPRAVQSLGVQGRFAMHLLLNIIEQPECDFSRWWVVSGTKSVTGYDTFSQSTVTGYAEPPPPEPSQIAVARDCPVRENLPACRVVSVVTPPTMRLHLVEYQTVLRWYRALPASMHIEPPQNYRRCSS
jgi:hypothetical protein